MNNITAYPTEQLEAKGKSIRYIFESVGNKSIIKQIEYSYFGNILGSDVYNLGFGDYNVEQDTISDKVNSNNGDMRKVFNTVLSSVPKFFEAHKSAGIWVTGSDEKRTKIYCFYVNRNFEQLYDDYLFYGYLKDAEPNLLPYAPKITYNGILVFKKN